MSQYFPPYRSSGRNIKVELDLSSYIKKANLKNVTHVDVGSFASKVNLDSLKTQVDKLDIDKLTPLVKNDAKKTEYNKLATKADKIDTTGFVLKTKYDTEKSGLERKSVMWIKKFLIQVV